MIKPSYHPTVERLVDMLSVRTGSDNRTIFRNEVVFYLANIASMMRVSIETLDNSSIPINVYTMNLAHSGFGKNFSCNTLEDLILEPFMERFIPTIYVPAAEEHMHSLAVSISKRNQKDPTEVYDDIQKEFSELGEFVPTFENATSAAIKQMRKKLLIAQSGSLNLVVDEVGLNLSNIAEALTDYLTLFDKGILKSKITKSTKENRRGINIDGITPANLLMFGAPAKVFDGGKTEEELVGLLDTGYARRLLYGFAPTSHRKDRLTPEELYENALRGNDTVAFDHYREYFQSLACEENFDITLLMPKETTLLMLEYKQDCEFRSHEFGNHQDILKAEMIHRYYKAQKVAGALAFADGQRSISTELFSQAVTIVEGSGEAFHAMMNRERNYVKLARYLSEVDVELTQVDLVEDLPFYTGAESKKKEMMNLAIAWGHRNNIIIKRNFVDGIEFFKGESLEEADLNKIKVAYSQDIVSDYLYEEVPFEDISELTQTQGIHWINHAMKNNYRKDANTIQGFNLLVIDVDGTASLGLARELLSDYTYHMYTTKRHTAEANRFRILLPMSHTVKLDVENYKEFMHNVYNWLPFEVDSETGQPSRKWLSHNGEYYENSGQLVDATIFIPKTRKSEQQQQFVNEHSDLTGLERWCHQEANKGHNRNNSLIKLGFALVDKGYDLESIKLAIQEFNQKLNNPVTKEELEKTIFVSVAKKLQSRD